MKTTSNNETITLNGTAVTDLIAQTPLQKSFIVAINTQFVAKGVYTETVLSESNKVDIVRPAVGG